MRAKDVAAYVLAGLLVLATVPIYRYIIRHARADVAREQAVSVQPNLSPAAGSVTYIQRPPIPESPQSVLVDPPAGVRCYGDAAIAIKGSAYTQAAGPDGRPLRCVGGKVLVPAR